ncbi:MAG TPA: hypothetical protein VFP01_04245, partial [Propionibacteriaceae bacterium]|nr:hypothetical protein [Propionibacteriaceae bacterium]
MPSRWSVAGDHLIGPHFEGEIVNLGRVDLEEDVNAGLEAGIGAGTSTNPVAVVAATGADPARHHRWQCCGVAR